MENDLQEWVSDIRRRIDEEIARSERRLSELQPNWRKNVTNVPDGPDFEARSSEFQQIKRDIKALKDMVKYVLCYRIDAMQDEELLEYSEKISEYIKNSPLLKDDELDLLRSSDLDAKRSLMKRLLLKSYGLSDRDISSYLDARDREFSESEKLVSEGAELGGALASYSYSLALLDDVHSKSRGMSDFDTSSIPFKCEREMIERGILATKTQDGPISNYTRWNPEYSFDLRKVVIGSSYIPRGSYQHKYDEMTEYAKEVRERLNSEITTYDSDFTMDKMRPLLNNKSIYDVRHDIESSLGFQDYRQIDYRQIDERCQRELERRREIYSYDKVMQFLSQHPSKFDTRTLAAYQAKNSQIEKLSKKIFKTKKVKAQILRLKYEMDDLRYELYEQIKASYMKIAQKDSFNNPEYGFVYYLMFSDEKHIEDAIEMRKRTVESVDRLDKNIEEYKEREIAFEESYQSQRSDLKKQLIEKLVAKGMSEEKATRLAEYMEKKGGDMKEYKRIEELREDISKSKISHDVELDTQAQIAQMLEKPAEEIDFEGKKMIA